MKKQANTSTKDTSTESGRRSQKSKKEAVEQYQFKTYNGVAEYCGVSAPVIRYHVTRGNLRRQPDGSFALKDVDEWREGYRQRGAGQKVDEKLRKADYRFRLARARLTELQHLQLKGELVPVSVMQEQLTARTFEASRRLMLLDRTIGNKLAIKAKKPLKEVQVIIKEAIREILEDFSRPIELN